jgi:hypothetical protein
MVTPPIIDAEFEVISSGHLPTVPLLRGAPPQSGRWTFWGDDLPNLAGIAAMFAGAIFLAAVFHHTPADNARRERQGFLAAGAAREHMSPAAYEAMLRAKFGN